MVVAVVDVGVPVAVAKNTPATATTTATATTFCGYRGIAVSPGVLPDRSKGTQS